MFVLTHAPWKVMLLDAQGRPLHEAAVAANASLLNFSAAAALRATTTGEWLMITHPFVLKGSPEDIRAAANSR
jgi:hypothetical protein